MKTLKIENMSHQDDWKDACYALMDGEEILSTHVCSNYSWAMGDLIKNRPELISELTEKYGAFQVEHNGEIWNPDEQSKGE